MKESLTTLFSSRLLTSTMLRAFLLLSLVSFASGQTEPFDLLETTIKDIHDAYQSGQLTSRQLVQLYLDRIEAYDQKGPGINSIITVNPKVLEEADKLDAAFKSSGFVGPLHGIPMVLKDQIDAKGMPTTLGSVVLRDYYPDRDAFAIEKLKEAGAIILAKATLGAWGGGDTHGSLFGSTRNPYDLDRTVGGSSGGPGAAVTANFSTLAVGQEGYASIRRPSTWNSLVGMRPSAGLISRGGVYGGWPSTNGSLGPMARTVRDLVTLLDSLVGYDPEDPLTARGVGHIPESYTKFLDKDGLKGARIGVLRESFGSNSEPGSEDFLKVSEVFDRAVGELKAAGAVIVDPIVVPNLKELLAKRANGPDGQESFKVYFGRSANPPFKSREEVLQSPDFAKMFPPAQRRLRGSSNESRHYQSLLAQEELMTNVLKVMADHQLDAIVHKSIEHQPTLIVEGANPPYVSSKGAPHLNTFLEFVPTITVPAGFTRDKLPAGISFLGRPYSEGTVIKLAYSYEQGTLHRRPPDTTPRLQRQP
ncbi:amidase family protein [Acidobacteria bacterium AH-259-D05]|nr:amidase family protein [Acidobacteria bacterium AH-259-D05]